MIFRAILSLFRCRYPFFTCVAPVAMATANPARNRGHSPLAISMYSTWTSLWFKLFIGAIATPQHCGILRIPQILASWRDEDELRSATLKTMPASRGSPITEEPQLSIIPQVLPRSRQATGAGRRELRRHAACPHRPWWPRLGARHPSAPTGNARGRHGRIAAGQCFQAAC